MPTPITSKRQMYRELNAGRFGNTVPAFMGLAEWEAREPRWDVPLWGVRSQKSGDPRTRLNVPTADVPEFCRRVFGPDAFNLSPMVDHMLVWRGEVFDSPTGLFTRGAFGLPHLEWRPAMRDHAVETCGVLASHLLRRVLNPNSLDDLTQLISDYPAHVIEFTALDRCYGKVPHRNAVVWEVREGMTGLYEGWKHYP